MRRAHEIINEINVETTKQIEMNKGKKDMQIK